jgi:putative acyl-CoA dehydrogenase
MNRNRNSRCSESESDKDDLKDLYRLLVPVCKYYITKRQPQFVYECMEIFGGNGYVEDFPMARLFRQSPLNSIWEGSGNVIALDVCKAINNKTIAALMKRLMTLNSEEIHLYSRYREYVNDLIR